MKRFPPVSTYSHDARADVVDDHHEDAEAAQQIDAHVALAAPSETPRSAN